MASAYDSASQASTDSDDANADEVAASLQINDLQIDSLMARGFLARINDLGLRGEAERAADDVRRCSAPAVIESFPPGLSLEAIPAAADPTVPAGSVVIAGNACMAQICHADGRQHLTGRSCVRFPLTNHNHRRSQRLSCLTPQRRNPVSTRSCPM